MAKKKKTGTSHQIAKGASETASHRTKQSVARGPLHAEVMAAPRARLPVVVTKGLVLLWRKLQHAGRLILCIFKRRNTGVLHPPAPYPANAPGGVDRAAAPAANAARGVDRVRCLAIWNEVPALHRHLAASATPERRQSPPPAPRPIQVQPQPPPAAPSPFQLVDDELVSDEELSMYAEYCKTRSNSGKMLVCHMCIFTDHKYYQNTFRDCEMLLHCWDIHKISGLECKYGGCRVRVTTGLELRRHRHFCHSIPKDWWKHYKES